MGSAAQSPKAFPPMDAIREELKTALTKRARKLKSETELVSGGAATEHAVTEVRVDDAVAEHPKVQLTMQLSEHAEVHKDLLQSMRVQGS